MKRKLILILILGLSISNVIGQLVDITYSVKTKFVRSSCGGEVGEEEYTAFLSSKDNVNGSWESTGCKQCNSNSACSYAQDLNLQTRINQAYTVFFKIDAWEDDNGSRCSYTTGALVNDDDCRRTEEKTLKIRETASPSSNTYTNTPTWGNSSDHQYQFSYTWRYSGNASAITPECYAQRVTETSSGIRSHSVYLTAGENYLFETTAGGDTYLQLYSSDGFTIVASDDNSGASLLSKINYTAANTGWYYIETSNSGRTALSINSTLTYHKLTTQPGDPSIFGSNQWNIYAFEGRDRDNLNNIAYKGYYTRNSLGINTFADYGSGDNALDAPSTASGYTGCAVPVTNHTVVAKRQGFPCGYYEVAVGDHDDEASLYINGTPIWADPCCNNNGIKWGGYLDASSTIEMRYAEGGGGHGMALIVTKTDDNGALSVSQNTTAASCPANNDGAIDVTLSGGLANIRYIRLTQLRESDDDAAINLQELEAIELFSGTNVALNKSVTSSNGNYANSQSGDLVDGRKNNDWNGGGMFHNVSSLHNAYVEVDLGSAYHLDYIQIFNRTNCCQARANNLLLSFYDASQTKIFSEKINVTSAQPYVHNVLDVSWSDGATTLDRTGLSSGTYTLNYNDVNNCNTTQQANIEVELGTEAPSNSVALASATSSAVCIVNDNKWHYFYNSSNELLAAVNSNGQNLGNVTVEIEVGNNGPYGSPSVECVSPTTGEYAVPRNWKITVQNQPSSNVNVRFYYLNSDVTALVNHINTLSADYINCWGDVNNESDLMMTVEHTDGSKELFTSLAFQAGPGAGMRMIEFQLGQFSQGWLHGKYGAHTGSPLPVEMTYFTAKAVENQKVHLDWQTVTEINNQGFVVERSKDGKNFVQVGYVKGNGNSNELNSYQYEDNNVIVGTYYYRLKQIDFDGKFEYSDIKAASIEGFDEGIALSTFIPNPAQHTTKLEVNLIEQSNISIQVIDNLGRKIETKILNLEAGVQDISFDLSNYKQGIYIAKIIVNNKSYVRKLIVE